MKRFLLNLIGLFTHNWGIKLISLALAIVIYHSIKSSNHSKIDNRDHENDRILFKSR